MFFHLSKKLSGERQSNMFMTRIQNERMILFKTFLSCVHCWREGLESSVTKWLEIYYGLFDIILTVSIGIEEEKTLFLICNI